MHHFENLPILNIPVVLDEYMKSNEERIKPHCSFGTPSSQKHRRIFNVHLHVDVEELRARVSDSMFGDLVPSQMQDFSA